MRKKLAVGVLSAVLLVGGATAVFGATDSAKLDEIKSLSQQMFGIQKQIIDKEVEAGLRTADQADAMKKRIDQRQQAAEQAITDGKVCDPGFGGKGLGIPGDGVKFKPGQPLTDEQLAAWTKAAEARIAAQEAAMKSKGMTDEQIAAWSTAAKAKLEEQKTALKNGTFTPKVGGMGKFGGHGGRAWGGKNGSSTTTPTTDANTQ